MGYEDIGAYYLKLAHCFLRTGDEIPLSADDGPRDEGYEYIQEFGGKVLWRHAEHDDPERQPASDDEQVVGRFCGYVLRATRAMNDGVDFHDHCDAHSQDIHTYATTFYAQTGEPIDSLWEDSITTGWDLLIIDELALHLDHRGRNLGLRLMRRLVDLFGPGCGMVATIPCPLQHQGNRTKVTSFNHHPEKNPHLARMKLEAYVQRLGFSPVEKSAFYVHSLSHAMLDEKQLRSQNRSPILVEESWRKPPAGPLS